MAGLAESIKGAERIDNMVTSSLQRITTEYSDLEDRIRLSGETENAATIVVWLTQRLLERLLPVLLQWLEQQNAATSHAEMLHDFAQQVAKAGLIPQIPVQAGADSMAWLALSVNIAQSEQAVSLTLRGIDGQDVNLTLTANPLRQWLAILHTAYCNAGWPLAVWPEWMRARTLPAMQQVVLH